MEMATLQSGARRDDDEYRGNGDIDTFFEIGLRGCIG